MTALSTSSCGGKSYYSTLDGRVAGGAPNTQTQTWSAAVVGLVVASAMTLGVWGASAQHRSSSNWAASATARPIAAAHPTATAPWSTASARLPSNNLRLRAQTLPASEVEVDAAEPHAAYGHHQQMLRPVQQPVVHPVLAWLGTLSLTIGWILFRRGIENSWRMAAAGETDSSTETPAAPANKFAAKPKSSFAPKPKDPFAAPKPMKPPSDSPLSQAAVPKKSPFAQPSSAAKNPFGGASGASGGKSPFTSSPTVTPPTAGGAPKSPFVSPPAGSKSPFATPGAAAAPGSKNPFAGAPAPSAGTKNPFAASDAAGAAKSPFTAGSPAPAKMTSNPFSKSLGTQNEPNFADIEELEKEGPGEGLDLAKIIGSITWDDVIRQSLGLVTYFLMIGLVVVTYQVVNWTGAIRIG
eukprot:CAMPEP_0174293452 /NCGR_PEP_ID=MMETSP0809-20121228/38623_1 /TAXON_ID=73025 ORGANISM="Eutreptiella gymnastica-like, Strain CCMP1594" /NCGR_SAMPLE_ID=MMETSP0809 /ASSEMBLY_ACC=CAM_ASM_000658 /LENGTH=409 /DNA_ID=CAMNT_0015394237 /DNA_START=27 /DNA_END=1256 /DNA_ORIENTATION=+